MYFKALLWWIAKSTILVFVGSTEAPSKVFLLFFLLPDWLKLNHLKSRMECGFSDIFSRHICSTVAETIGVTNNPVCFGAKKMFRKPHFKMLRWFLAHGTNNMESLLLRCNKPFHFFSKNTHITFLLINFYDKRRINTNRTFQVIIIRSCLVLLILTPFALNGWLNSLLIATDLIKVK